MSRIERRFFGLDKPNRGSDSGNFVLADVARKVHTRKPAKQRFGHGWRTHIL
jgi:hypothetical protein